jgi:hypothetical protein
MWRLARVLLAVVLGVVVTAPAASAAPHHESWPAPDRDLATLLGELWETVLKTPVPENPLAAGEPWCVDLDGAVAPFTLDPAAVPTCTVDVGTEIFVAALSVECSTVEEPPFYGGNEAELRQCVRDLDVLQGDLTVTVDGEPVPLTLVESPLLRLDLPEDNLLGVPAQQALSVASGLVALLQPLPPGTHEIVTTGTGTVLGDFTNVTTIVVQPGWWSTHH